MAELFRLDLEDPIIRRYLDSSLWKCPPKDAGPSLSTMLSNWYLLVVNFASPPRIMEDSKAN